jgi:hypothetical protein
MSGPTRLEQSFADICNEHGLHSLSVGFLKADHSPEGWFTADVQRVDRADRLCGRGSSGTIADAVAEALADLSARFPATLADEPLTELAA